MPICPPLSSPTTPSVSLPSLCLSLDCVFLGTILSICVFSATWASPSISGCDPSLPFGVSLSTLPCIGILSSFPVPMAHSGSFLLLSLVLGSHLGLTFSCHVPVISDAGFHPSIHLCAGSCHSVSRPAHLGPSPAHLSSSVPSSPLLPSPSAVSPTGSACCSRCSCTAVWGPWPGAT